MQPRVGINVVKQMAWVLKIRRAVFERYNRSPVPGSVTLLAPHYKEGVDKMHSDMAEVIRFVSPSPIPQDPESSKGAITRWGRRIW